jgi:hypothetical protein
MTFLKVMFAVALGTYVAYEFTVRNSRKNFPKNKRIAPVQETSPSYPQKSDF